MFILVTLVIMIGLSPPLAAVTFGGVIPMTIISRVYSNFMRTLQRRIQTEKSYMNNVAEESFANIRTVKAFSNEREEMGKFFKSNNQSYKVGVKKSFWQAIYTLLTQALLYGSMAAVIYVGSKLFENGEISIGQISTFLFYMLVLVFQFSVFAWTISQFASVIGASDKIVQIMKHEVLTNQKGGDMIEGEIDGRIELRNVKFCYPGKSDVKVLKGVSLSVDNDKNRVVALCGTSGCGKSSIISLIERFYDPTEGEVLFNGRNIKELDPKWYHNQVGIVQQEPVLFSGSIGENILYGLDLEDNSQEAIDARMDEACR